MRNYGHMLLGPTDKDECNILVKNQIGAFSIDYFFAHLDCIPELCDRMKVFFLRGTDVGSLQEPIKTQL